jgi:hypothetical protein
VGGWIQSYLIEWSQKFAFRRYSPDLPKLLQGNGLPEALPVNPSQNVEYSQLLAVSVQGNVGVVAQPG